MKAPNYYTHEEQAKRLLEQASEGFVGKGLRWFGYLLNCAWILLIWFLVSGLFSFDDAISNSHAMLASAFFVLLVFIYIELRRMRKALKLPFSGSTKRTQHQRSFGMSSSNGDMEASPSHPLNSAVRS